MTDLQIDDEETYNRLAEMRRTLENAEEGLGILKEREAYARKDYGAAQKLADEAKKKLEYQTSYVENQKSHIEALKQQYKLALQSASIEAIYRMCTKK